MPRLRYRPDRRPRHRTPAEGEANSRTGKLYAVEGLLAGPRLPIQAKPLGGAAADEDFGLRSPVDVVAGGAIARAPPSRPVYAIQRASPATFRSGRWAMH